MPRNILNMTLYFLLINTKKIFTLYMKRNKLSSITQSIRYMTALRETSSTSEIDKFGYPNFSFTIHKESKDNKARTGELVTPHGVIHTPNFVFCATKAAMKSLGPDQLRNEGTEIMLSNTYHLMLTPGSEVIEQMGGLQKFTGWNGPMLTDSGGYQIFSMGFGSVSSEIKGRRGGDSEQGLGASWNQTLIGITEKGAKFRSYVNGMMYDLTPERSIEIQRQLGADLIVVLDECTPFNVDKSYTEASMHRSHRWALRSLEEFKRTHTGKQALYGIIQGGVYEDLRKESAEFVNNHEFFGTAIGGSLGATKQDMYDIVKYTRSIVRDDRPVHLLGIGGIRDIFHGVRQGIDTFDCVHPSRLARHGGALVLASYWDQEEPNSGFTSPHTTYANARKVEKLQLKDVHRNKQLEKKKLIESSNSDNIIDDHDNNNQVSNEYITNNENISSPSGNNESSDMATTIESSVESATAVGYYSKINTKKKGLLSERVIREHINVTKAPFRNDPRPIDSNCQCYTCKTFSRAYLHHLFKAKELLGGTLVTIHNVHYMNNLMRDIRTGIENDSLDSVQQKYVHPKLIESLNKENNLSLGA